MRQSSRSTVVLLHGIARTGRSMRRMELALRRAGHDVLNLSYPSRRLDLGGLAGFVANRLVASDVWTTAPRVHFVTHSMGGLVAARYLQDFAASIPEEKLGRVVMLAPPNRGSEVADLLHTLPPYRWLYGPAGQELTTAARQRPADPPPGYQLGIIAGRRGWPYLLGQLVIREPHDGRVAVQRTKVEGMQDHLVVPATHTFISWHPKVQRQVLRFLEAGHFDHQDRA